MPVEIWDLIKAYGAAALPLAILAWMYWLERSERKETQAELVQTLREVTATVKDATGAAQLTAQLISELAKQRHAA